jgi:tetratricopeptide (TPR) repeat protein
MRVSPGLQLTALLAGCFTLATGIEPVLNGLKRRPAAQGDLMAAVLGDSRRLFANHFFIKADVYFHSGYYPSIFNDQKLHEDKHLAGEHEEHAEPPAAAPGSAVPAAAPRTDAPHPEKPHADHDEHAGEEEPGDILGKPKDWIDSFSRHFYISQHTHLGREGLEREILPWLRISASLDPERVETCTISSYWLRTHLGKVREAEEFLHEGLRANPNSAAILYELGALTEDNRHDAVRARNIWETALRRWQQTEATKAEPDLFLFQQIVGRLARLEYREHRYAESVAYFKLLKAVSPNPAQIQKNIDEISALIPKR